jgi:TonB-dependent starch-binding outer membrane protein SusC
MRFHALCKDLSFGRLLTTSAFGGSGYANKKYCVVTKTMRVMQLTAFIMLFFSLQVSAIGISQTITLSAKDASLQTVFKEVKKQSGYLISYNASILKTSKHVTVSVKNYPLEDFIKLILSNQNHTYVLKDKSIIIKPTEDLNPGLHDHAFKPEISLNTPPITGVVRGPDGQPIAGANVIVKGTKRGTTTNADGSFVIEADNGEVLIISSVGFVDQQLNINNGSIGPVMLIISESKLDEVQIIAYGTIIKRLSTGNVSTVKARDIEKQPVQNPLLALQGRAPGVVIEQSTGLPGSGVKVRIQGQNSLNRGSDPLYVIDGIPYTSQLLPTLSSVQGESGGGPDPTGSGSPLSFINPKDIESIDILKDADATSIYGSRAAAGAILITTKKGKAGKTKLDINLQSGYGKVARRVNVLNTNQYLEMRREALKNDGITAPGETDYDINGIWKQNRETDWQKELIGGRSTYNNLQLSLSGGNEKTQFLVGGGYHKESTVFPGNLADEKGSLHFNLNNVSNNQKFRFQLDMKYLLDNNQILTSDLTGPAVKLAPNAPALYNADGTLNWEPLANGNSTWQNPLSFLLSKYKNKTNNLLSNAVLSYQVIPGLEVKSNFGYTNLQNKEITTVPLGVIAPEFRPFNKASANFGSGSIASWIVEPQITYKREIGKGAIDIMAGSTFLQSNSDGEALGAYGYNSDLVLEDIRSATTVIANNTVSSVYKYNAIFGRLNYNYQNRYIINLTTRRDGSSRFGAENQFHNFGAIGAAWLFSNEEIFKKTFSFLSFGKIRGSYGTTGNEQIGNYQFMSLYSSRTRLTPYQNAIGLRPDGLSNPYLQWEETRKLQFGIDLGFIKDKILFNANYYRNRSSNQLQSYALPIMVGVGEIIQNFPAKVQNSGWEFSVNTTNLKSQNFTWTTSINLTITKNKLLEYEGLESSSFSDRYVIGKPITINKVYKSAGVDPQTGAYQFSDIDGKLTPYPDYSKDRTAIFDLTPKYYGGFQNSFSYKGISLDILFQLVKQIGVDYTLGDRPGTFYGNNGNQPVSVLERWQKPGDITRIQRYSSDFSLFLQSINATSSSLVYSDASFIRLKNLSLSWQLPGAWKSRAGLQNAGIFLQGQNLFTITKYIGLDPETKSSISLPPLRVITFGLNITL